MNIRDYLTASYPVVHPYDEIKTVESLFDTKGYIVVVDELHKYFGILTPFDILKEEKKSVIECLTNKEIVQTDDSLALIMDKFYSPPTEALPVFKDDTFLGILEKKIVHKKLMDMLNSLSKESIYSREAWSSFLRNFTQEVKTPINQTLDFMSSMANLTPSEMKSVNCEKFFTTIKKSSEQLLTVMNSISELSPLIADETLKENNDFTTIEPMFCKLKEYFEGIASTSRDSLKIGYYTPDTNLALLTNYNKLYHLLYNLLDTNIRNTKGNTAIEFGCEIFSYKSRIQFYIRNFGIKIDNSQKKALIEFISGKKSTYYSNGTDHTFRFDMIKSLAEQLGGTLSLEIDDSGIFTVYFSMQCIVMLEDAS